MAGILVGVTALLLRQSNLCRENEPVHAQHAERTAQNTFRFAAGEKNLLWSLFSAFLRRRRKQFGGIFLAPQAREMSTNRPFSPR